MNFNKQRAAKPEARAFPGAMAAFELKIVADSYPSSTSYQPKSEEDNLPGTKIRGDSISGCYNSPHPEASITIPCAIIKISH